MYTFNMTKIESFSSYYPNSPLGEIFFSIVRGKLAYLSFGVTMNKYFADSTEHLGNLLKFIPETNIQVKESLKQYFEFKTPLSNLVVDISLLTDFQQKVLLACMDIPFGTTINYGQLAKTIGIEKGAQAVGQALRYNPIPIVIPCHRVIASDSSLGGYGGVMGSEDKIFLLKHENAFLI
jgi:methylated-DNA-[protein]-cysteine S-methyltransferase